jgi:hypothetical protein
MNSFIDSLKTVNNSSSSNNNESTTRIRNCDFEVAFDKMAVKSLANLKSRFDFQTKHTF